MTTNTTVLLLVTALALLVLTGVLTVVAYRTRRRRHGTADTTIRDEVAEDIQQVRRQQMLADQYAANIRAIDGRGRTNEGAPAAARRAPPVID